MTATIKSFRNRVHALRGMSKAVFMGESMKVSTLQRALRLIESRAKLHRLDDDTYIDVVLTTYKKKVKEV